MKINISSLYKNHFFDFFVYFLLSISSFLFLAFIPQNFAKEFLSHYSLSMMIVSVFAVVIYTGFRNRIFDLSISLFTFISCLATFCDTMIPFYWMAAISLSLSDFAISQTSNNRMQTFMRLLTSASCFIIIFDFFLALLVRTIICAAGLAWSSNNKQPSRFSFSVMDSRKAMLCVINVLFYYVPLSIIPHIVGVDVKATYLLYAIAGSMVLKIQDYIVKLRVAGVMRLKDGNGSWYYIVCGGTIICLGIALTFVAPKMIFLCVPMALLATGIRIVENVTWK
jgi:hypothetical protein